MRSLRLGRIMGIDIAVDRSWIFVFLLLTWNLSSLFTLWHPDWSFSLIVGSAIAATLIFFLSLLVHELAHSLVGKAYGVPVRSITLFLFGGVSQFEQEPPSAGADLLISLVGPIASVVLGVLFFLLFSISASSTSMLFDDPEIALMQLDPWETLFLWLGPINVMVGLFNLIPAFPLDGGRALRALIWAIGGRQRQATRAAAVVGQAIAWIMIALGIAAIFGAHIPFVGRGVVSGIWFAFIGWFLHSAALRASEQTYIEELFEGILVSRLMRTRGPAVAPEMPISRVVNEVFLRSPDRVVPVVQDGRLLGMLGADAVRAAPPEQWDVLTAGSLAVPASRSPAAAPNEPVATALRKLMESNSGVVPVVEGPVQGDFAGAEWPRLLGLLFAQDVARWIELHRGRGSMLGTQWPMWQG